MTPPRLIHGDNLAAMRDLGAAGERFHLVYLDPPFCTGQRFMMGDVVAFDDRWPNLETYLDHLRRRVAAAWGLLARPEGNLVVHVDPRVGADVRRLLDEELGRGSFCDEVVWRYRRWPTRARRCQRVHDVLFRYAPDPARARWTQAYEEPSRSTLETWGRRRQRAVTRNGRRVRSEALPEESPGVPIGDVWEFSIIAPRSQERTGYPTQKPEKLLERVITLWSAPGDAVLDPYCGSGTTLAVAERLGRRWTGIDSSPVAVEVARARLAAACLPSIAMADGVVAEPRCNEVRRCSDWSIRPARAKRAEIRPTAGAAKAPEPPRSPTSKRCASGPRSGTSAPCSGRGHVSRP